MDHKSHETMRAYLLGLLSDDQASMLEQEYFVNRAFFLEIQREENALIQDYLDGSLRGQEKQSFESRYLKTPDLRDKVEEARKQRDALRPTVLPLWRSPRLGIAAGLMLALGLGMWVYFSCLHQQAHSSAQVHPPNQSNSTEVQPPPDHDLAIFLTPGIRKGAGSDFAHFPQPPANAIIRLVLQMPGELSPVERIVRIAVVKPDGSLSTIWASSHPVLSALTYGIKPAMKPAPVGASKDDQATQALILFLTGSLFEPGDYLVRISTADGKLQETYEYRVTERD